VYAGRCHHVTMLLVLEKAAPLIDSVRLLQWRSG
jgi:hypothetical protein